MVNEIASKYNVKVSGEGKQTILFAHGFGCDQNMWRFIVPAFEQDYKLVLFDYIGCGKSDVSAYNTERYESLQGYAQDILDICEEYDLHDVILIGHSVSSLIAILASIQKPELFKHLILVSPSPRFVNDEDYIGGFAEEDLRGLLSVMESNFSGWAEYLAPVVMKNPDLPDLTKELEETFCANDPTITRKFAELTFFCDNRDDLNKVSIPTLVLQCSEDDLAPDHIGKYVSDQIEESTFKQMQATGHCPHMSHPEETVALIKEYLSH
ncbi:alpha/beta fold hydrolase [Maribacter sp. 2307UL18-2]|uniref:alpha/beta fold hydrolase n=1 Tax=Maribacter sp. 2307UL18-2 TaxID=3386274 RepID=UPI0039BD7627